MPICKNYFYVNYGKYQCKHTVLEIRAYRYKQKDKFKKQLKLKREKDAYQTKKEGQRK